MALMFRRGSYSSNVMPEKCAIPHLSEDSLVAVLTLTFCVFILRFLLSGG